MYKNYLFIDRLFQFYQFQKKNLHCFNLEGVLEKCYIL